MGSYSDNTPAIHDLAQKMISNSMIDTSLYSKYNVKRGLRDLDGKGVLTGLTDISTILQNKEVDGKLVPCDGELYYRGYNINDIIGGILEDDRFGFEEVVYLLLFGEMPNAAQLKDFKELLVKYRTLPQNFVRDVILKAPSEDMMNSIARSVLTLFCYDDNPNDTSVDNVLRQCIQLISVFPMLSVYGYHAYNHYLRDKSLYIHRAEPTMSTAEVILSLLRPDRKYTPLEAKVLDMALILHMEHGGGNNSTFTTHVVTSSGTDTYSATAAALASLKGPKHGGANVKVFYMFEDIKEHIKDWKDDEEIAEKIHVHIKSHGSQLAPLDSWLILRGIKTLPVRMDRHNENAKKVAEWLRTQPKVQKVYYVGFEDHKDYAVTKKQTTGFGGMISFTVDSFETVKKILKGVDMIMFAESLGGTETLITYPTTQTHEDTPLDIKEKLGITDCFLRMSVGIENADDIIADLDRAMNA